MIKVLVLLAIILTIHSSDARAETITLEPTEICGVALGAAEIPGSPEINRGYTGVYVGTTTSMASGACTGFRIKYAEGEMIYFDYVWGKFPSTGARPPGTLSLSSKMESDGDGVKFWMWIPGCQGRVAYFLKKESISQPSGCANTGRPSTSYYSKRQDEVPSQPPPGIAVKPN